MGTIKTIKKTKNVITNPSEILKFVIDICTFFEMKNLYLIKITTAVMSITYMVYYIYTNRVV